MNALCERAYDKSNLTAYVSVAARWGKNSGTRDSRISPTDRLTRVEPMAIPGPRKFIVHIWRWTRILERDPIPQHRNVIVFSLSSSLDPEQYDGNRHTRNAMVCYPTSLGSSQTLISNLINHSSRAFGENEILG